MKNIQISNRNYATLNRIGRESGMGTPDSVVRKLIKTYGSELVQPQAILVDLNPAQGRACYTQEKWIELYNSQEGEFQGKRMISVANMFNPSRISPREALASLQKDCLDYFVMTSTHNSFKPHGPKPFAGDVIHNYGSKIVRSKVISLDVIPALQGQPISIIEQNSDLGTQTLWYVRALADDMQASPGTLLERAETLAQKTHDNIILSNPNLVSRDKNPERAVRLGGCGGRFHIDGYVFDYYVGHSRGVSVSPRSGRAKK